ncbi:MAG TPA: hypothetical protein VGE59_04135 [Patescibacteria group bacterium]
MMHKSLIALFIASFMLWPLGDAQAADKTAILKLSVPTSTVTQGNQVTVSLSLLPGGQAVIGTQVTLYFSSTLTYQSFDGAGSIFDTEIDVPTVNGNTLSFSRVAMNTSYVGTEGLIGKITFVANEPGAGDITIQEATTQVKADSDLTNILQSTQSAHTTISAPTVTTTVTPTPTPTATPTASISPAATSTPKASPKATTTSQIVVAVTASSKATPSETPLTTTTPSTESSPEALIDITPTPNPIQSSVPTSAERSRARSFAIALVVLGACGTIVSLLYLRGSHV